MAAVAELVASNKISRPIHSYPIPESVRKGSDMPMPKTVGLRELSAEQELLASKLGRLDFSRAQYEAAKLSIAELDGKPVGNTEGEVDKFWDRCSPKLRSLLMEAYNRISSPSKEEMDDFFGGETITVK